VTSKLHKAAQLQNATMEQEVGNRSPWPVFPAAVTIATKYGRVRGTGTFKLGRQVSNMRGIEAENARSICGGRKDAAETGDRRRTFAKARSRRFKEQGRAD